MHWDMQRVSVVTVTVPVAAASSTSSSPFASENLSTDPQPTAARPVAKAKRLPTMRMRRKIQSKPCVTPVPGRTPSTVEVASARLDQPAGDEPCEEQGGEREDGARVGEQACKTYIRPAGQDDL